MTFEEIVDQALAMLQRRGRVAYRTLKRQFNLDDDALDDLKVELIEAQQVAIDEDGNVLVWTGDVAAPPLPASAPAAVRARPSDVGPRTYTPAHLAEKILTARTTLEGDASRSPCSLPTSRTRRSSSVALIPKPPNSSSILPCIA